MIYKWNYFLEFSSGLKSELIDTREQKGNGSINEDEGKLGQQLMALSLLLDKFITGKNEKIRCDLSQQTEPQSTNLKFNILI